MLTGDSVCEELNFFLVAACFAFSVYTVAGISEQLLLLPRRSCFCLCVFVCLSLRRITQKVVDEY